MEHKVNADQAVKKHEQGQISQTDELPGLLIRNIGKAKKGV